MIHQLDAKPVDTGQKNHVTMSCPPRSTLNGSYWMRSTPTDVSVFNMAHGACWEPALAEYNLALNLVNQPSLDPSAPLPFWDKCRLLLHGRLTMSVQTMSWLYHASLDPYNTTEMMDWTWTSLVLDWTTGRVHFGVIGVGRGDAIMKTNCGFIKLLLYKKTGSSSWIQNEAVCYSTILDTNLAEVYLFCFEVI